MKRYWCLVMAFLLLLLPLAQASALTLPDESETLSLQLAQDALMLCSGHTAERTAQVFSLHGVNLVRQANFDKPDHDPSHTVAYTIGEKSIVVDGQEKTLIVVAIRGTNAGEWYSNFDFAPSRSDDAIFAENFLFAAQDVFLAVQEVAAAAGGEPVFLLCGHSRGAAAANLLALLTSAAYGEENVYAYTFATPMTLRSDDAALALGNTFNFINPCDLVPYMPLAQWGYHRVGTDVIFQGDAQLIAEVEDIVDVLSALAPSISAYYTERHSLTGKGLAEMGLTAYEVMLIVAQSLAGAPAQVEGGTQSIDFLRKTDFEGLVMLIDRYSTEDAQSSLIFSQHMPDTYMALLAQHEENQ